MNEQGVRVDPQAMNDDGLQTQNCAGDFAQELGSLNQNVEALLRVWNEGPARNKFAGSYEEQKVNLKNFQMLLDELGFNITKSASILDRTETDNSQMWG